MVETLDQAFDLTNRFRPLALSVIDAKNCSTRLRTDGRWE
jgi:hypothetical protein